ncbi:hypothetical protein TKK_0015834 [Trichogramma kaykai]
MVATLNMPPCPTPATKRASSRSSTDRAGMTMLQPTIWGPANISSEPFRPRRSSSSGLSSEPRMPPSV